MVVTEAQTEITPEHYLGKLLPIWCRGCGYYNVLHALIMAFSELKLHFSDIFVSSGIGCSGRFPGFLNTYGFNGLHGRPLPVATGVKIANPKLTVLAVSGDGDAFNIGGNHISHAAKRNIDIKYIILDNRIFGLTKGQYSSTTRELAKTPSSPYGSPENSLRTLELLLSYDSSFIAQGYSGEKMHLVELFVKALSHPGFAVVNILSHCPTYNRRDVSSRMQQNIVFLDENLTHEQARAMMEKNRNLTLYEENGYTLLKDRVTGKRSLVGFPNTDKQAAYELVSRVGDVYTLLGVLRQVNHPTLENRYDEIYASPRATDASKDFDKLWSLL